MTHYSAYALLRHALTRHRSWPRMWRDPTPKKHYDVIIIGGGGHGLATAYYLAKNFQMKNIAVLERGWIGGGATGRNTSIIRSNYLWDESAAIYDFSLKLYETLSDELNFNIMVSQRGVLNLAHSLSDVRNSRRRVYANRLNGIDAEWLDAKQVKDFCPQMSIDPGARYPVLGATLQRRGGTARHDAVAWGYARAASELGVDIIQSCEVTGITVKNNRAVGVETNRGAIGGGKVAIVVAANASHVAKMAGVELPIESHPLQAYVSEPLKPFLDSVVMSGAVHVYLSQSDKGELVMGAGIDTGVGYGMRGSIRVIEDQLASAIQLFPFLSRVRLMRAWAGTVDTAPDASPIVGKTPVDRLYINCGWGTGGFKSTPGSGWVLAHTIAHDRPHELNAPFNLERFVSGALVDEHGAAAVAH